MTDITPYGYLKARHGEAAASKLTQVKAREIYERRQLGKALLAEAKTLSNTALADKYGQHHKHIGRIINGGRWANPGPNYAGMSYADAQLIRQAASERDRLKSLAAVHSCKRLAVEYGISEAMALAIGNGRRWAYVGVAA